MKYWVYMNGEVPGSYEPEELAAMPGFSDTAMVCPAQGGISERSWQRAGQFPEVVEALSRIPRPAPPPPPVARDAAAAARDLNETLNDASSRIFDHVTELMKELENRREERALTQSLQRQLVELKNELFAARERIKNLDGRVSLIPGFEEREKRMQDMLSAARGDIKERDRAITELNRQNSNLSQEFARVQRSEASLSEDLKQQCRINEELSKSVAHKEFTLAKAFGVIRKLESMLGGIVPVGAPPAEATAAEAASAPEAPADPAAEPEVPAQPHDDRPGPEQAHDQAYAQEDNGLPPQSELPAEGEVKTVPAPWQSTLKKIFRKGQGPQDGRSRPS